MLKKTPRKCHILSKRNLIILLNMERAKTLNYVVSGDGRPSVEVAKTSPVGSLELVQHQISGCFQIVALDCHSPLTQPDLCCLPYIFYFSWCIRHFRTQNLWVLKSPQKEFLKAFFMVYIHLYLHHV